MWFDLLLHAWPGVLCLLIAFGIHAWNRNTRHLSFGGLIGIAMLAAYVAAALAIFSKAPKVIRVLATLICLAGAFYLRRAVVGIPP